ncbi:MAG: DNA polymerase I [Myxococcota bacterium]
MTARTPKSRSPEGRRLVVIDGANAIYRAFFAIPALRAPDGTPTNATLGFANMLGKVLREEEPDLVAVAFDPRGGTFRHRLFEDYKAGRDAQPEDLSAQIPLVRELIEAYGISVIEVEDFEADDVIATLVASVPDDVSVTIVSTDKDLMQLVSDRVVLADGMKDRRYGPAEVEERFGVPPERMLDLRSLVGDPSDNIPGVKGIGQKGAAKLIEEWGSLDHLLDHVEEVNPKRARTALEQHGEDARFSRELAVLRADVPLPLPVESLVFHEPDVAVLRALFQRLGFTRLLDSLGTPEEGSGSPAAAGGQSVEVEIAEDSGALERFAAAHPVEQPLAVVVVATGGSVADARPVGVALASHEDRALYVPLRAESDLALEGIAIEALVETLRSLILPQADTGKASPWIGTEVKRTHAILERLGCRLPAAVGDPGIAAFLLDSSGARGLGAVASQFGLAEVPSWEDLAGRGAKQVSAEKLPMTDVASWAARNACTVQCLQAKLRQRLEHDGLWDLYSQVEMPLSRVLARMESVGVRIDEEQLAALSEEYTRELSYLEAEIYQLAGEEFLVSSPKQLQIILFEKLRLPVIKKTKTGYSTAEDVLVQLSAHHELPGRILAWRRLSKLKSTYIDALPLLVNRQTGRIHPSFNQAGAATGRLSASNPNVQNIPIRTEEGIRIREAFIPEEGRVLVSADYSQVELRILAHYSGDENLVDAFQKGEDIHRRTAAEVAGIPPEAVDAEQRSRAKAVNFGIIYGSSAFGLANQLSIAVAEAQEAIDAYFSQYPGVRRFLEETVAEAKERGFVQTLLGRRRYLPDLASRNRVLRQAAERMAVNSVIQGSEADLIKQAMVEVDVRLDAEGFEARMILQVHDELVFEVPEAEVEALSDLVRRCMEGVYALAVPLIVDLGVGANWREAH